MKLLLLALTITFILSPRNINAQVRQVTDGKFTYETVEGDPLKTRIYTLSNGL